MNSKCKVKRDYCEVKVYKSELKDDEGEVVNDKCKGKITNVS